MKKKQLWSLLMCMLVLVGSLSACKKSEETNTEVVGEEAESQNGDTSTSEVAEKVEVDFSEAAEYSYWLYATPGDYNSDYNLNPVVQYLNKKFNMTLSFQQPSAGTETDSLSLMLGTGEYTDVIDSVYYSGSINQLYEDGVIIDIAQYLDYMPNLKALLDQDETFRKNSLNDEGQLLRLPILQTVNENMWGGLVYRRDILETMTGNNVAFPSGNAEPTTIADWEYMLPLYKMYFEASGMPEFAPLILPAKGYFDSGELLTGFGTAASYFIKDGKVAYGPMEDGFYNYLSKMKEWYELGYIYKDFASRTNDLFYLPNTALTYGAAAGIWFGINSQLGDVMSMPDYGLYVDVHAMANPIDQASGIEAAPNYMYAAKNEKPGGAMISSSCENVERLLTTFDFLYSQEGALLKGYGLTVEQGAAEDPLYIANGLSDGAYVVNADGTYTFHSQISLSGGPMSAENFTDVRMPGLFTNDEGVANSKEIDKAASATWLRYGTEGKLPAMHRTEEEETIYSGNQSNLDDYVNSMVLKFIIGGEELNDEAWNAFKSQLEAYGILENLEVQQAAYERYLAR